MVTTTGPQEIDENIEVITPEVPEEQAPGGDEVATEEQPTEEAPAEAVAAPDTTEQQPEASLLTGGIPPRPQVDQSQLLAKQEAELRRRRIAEQDQQWRTKVSSAAKSYQKQLEEAGYLPEQALDQAKRYVQQERKFRQQDEQASQIVDDIKGRQVAMVHFMKKHGLANDQVLNDLIALQNTTNPAEMDSLAKRIKEDRALRTELAQLKQGRVTPQTFDNSQGSAEATTNQGRLLDAYLAGDRSDAAVRAARNQTFGA